MRALSPRLSIAAVLLACFFLSAGTLITRAALKPVNALVLTLVQIVTGTAAVWTACAWKRRRPRLRDLPLLAAPGLLQPGLVYLLRNVGLLTVSVSVEAFLFNFETIVVLLLSLPLLRERVSRRQAAIAFTGTAGILLLGGTQPDFSSAPNSLGVLFILIAVVCAALDTIASRRIVQRAHPLTLSTVSNLAGLVLVMAVGSAEVMPRACHRWTAKHGCSL